MPKQWPPPKRVQNQERLPSRTCRKIVAFETSLLCFSTKPFFWTSITAMCPIIVCFFSPPRSNSLGLRLCLQNQIFLHRIVVSIFPLATEVCSFLCAFAVVKFRKDNVCQFCAISESPKRWAQNWAFFKNQIPAENSWSERYKNTNFGKNACFCDALCCS